MCGHSWGTCKSPTEGTRSPPLPQYPQIQHCRSCSTTVPLLTSGEMLIAMNQVSPLAQKLAFFTQCTLPISTLCLYVQHTLLSMLGCAWPGIKDAWNLSGILIDRTNLGFLSVFCHLTRLGIMISTCLCWWHGLQYLFLSHRNTHYSTCRLLIMLQCVYLWLQENMIATHVINANTCYQT